MQGLNVQKSRYFLFEIDHIEANAKFEAIVTFIIYYFDHLKLF